jgi:4'-phosphopantetheinyl transferase
VPHGQESGLVPTVPRCSGSTSNALPDNSIKVWILRPDARIFAEAFAILDEGERKRGDQLIRSEDRETYVTTHAALRLLLSEALGLPPREIKFSQSASGKPGLSSLHAHSDIDMSISHSAGLAAVALSRRGPVGIDIERKRHVVDCLHIAASAFGAEVTRRLASSDGPRRQEIFLRLWTAAEAYAKATGIGLAEIYGKIPLTLAGDDMPLLGANGVWTLQPLEFATDCVGSLVTKAPDATSTPTIIPTAITLAALFNSTT